MISVAGTQRIKRTVLAPFIFEDETGRHEQEISVEFYARTISQIREERERNMQRASLYDDRERLRTEMAAANQEMEAAKAVLGDAKGKAKTVAMEKANEATRTALKAIHAFNDKAKEIATLEPQWISVRLASMVAGLPDLEDPLEPGKPFVDITADKLEQIAVENLEAIEAAIEEGVEKKSPPSK